MWFKSPAPLGDFEQLVLLGVLRLDPDAYGAAIRQEIHARSGRDISINAVYTTLDRLETKGLLKSWVGEPTPQRVASGDQRERQRRVAGARQRGHVERLERDVEHAGLEQPVSVIIELGSPGL